MEEIDKIFVCSKVDYNAVKLRSSVDEIGKQLFHELDLFKGFARLHLHASDSDFKDSQQIPPSAILSGDKGVLLNFFGTSRDRIPWSEIVEEIESPKIDSDRFKTDSDRLFFSKWLQETEAIVLKS
jgi:hypothetical protein